MLSTNRVPVGFRIIAETPELWIRYRSKGTDSIVAFMILFVLVFITFLLSGILTVQKALKLGYWQSVHTLIDGGIWSLLHIGWRLFVLYFLSIFIPSRLWFIFGVTDFKASQESLIVVTRFLGFSSKQQIPSHTIHSLVQIKDGGENMDPFPSWGLLVIANQKVGLLARQPIEKSNWLGKVLANFYGVQFVQSKKRQ